MKKLKKFIYMSDDKYFQKTISVKRDSIKVDNICFELDFLKGLKKVKCDLFTLFQMSGLVCNSKILFLSRNFSNGHVIVTNRGIILANKIPFFIYDIAASKYKIREEKLSSYFGDLAYRIGYNKAVEENYDFINDMLDFEKIILVNSKITDVDLYMSLLNCIVESSLPLKSYKYDEEKERLNKEYQKYLLNR